MEDAEKCAPRPDSIPVLMRKDARDLVQVGKVVNGPGGKKLRERDGTERGMTAATLKIGWLQIHPAKLPQIFSTQLRELLKQLRQGLSFTLALLS